MASYHEIQDINQKSSAKKGPKVLSRIEHERSENGGHIFTHRFKNDGPGYHEPETHIFGADEHEKAAAHFHKHAGLKVTIKPVAVDADEGEDGDSAAGAAY